MTTQTDSTAPIPMFSLGHVVATPGALAAMRSTSTDPVSLLARHASGDWGDVCDEDKVHNNDAVVAGWRLLSAYSLPVREPRHAQTVWIITESDRSVTTFLLPKEY